MISLFNESLFQTLRRRFFVVAIFSFVFGTTFIFSPADTFAQSTRRRARPLTKKAVVKTVVALPKVILLDDVSFRTTLKPNGRPMLVNFWATWCDPCREEFPDLVKIANDFKDKIDFVTISLDDPAEINRDVPKFLLKMKAEPFANYLLSAKDEEAAIIWVLSDWMGGLPFTIILAPENKSTYSRQGKIRPAILRAEIERLLKSETAESTF